MRLSASTTSGFFVGSGCLESLNMVPSELMRLRMVALLFLAAMKSKCSATRSGVTSAERRAVFTLLYRQIKEDNDRARRFAKKLEGHRKHVRYEQRAVNQIRKAARIKK